MAMRVNQAAKGGAGSELIEVFVGADVSVLHDVFGFGVAVQDGAGNAVETLVVAAHDDFVQPNLSRTYAAYNLFVRQAFRFGFLWNYGWPHGSLIPTRVQDKEKVTKRLGGLDGALKGRVGFRYCHGAYFS